jgi:hypothetical protein
MIPALARSCCRCGGSIGAGVARVGGVGGSGNLLGEAALSSDGASSLSLAGSGPESWKKSPVAGVAYRVPVRLYAQLSRAKSEPVMSRSRCGHDRDCIPDDRERPSYFAALPPAYVWVKAGYGRFVDIMSKDGQTLLSHITGSESDYVDMVSTSQDEQEMKMIQRSPNAGRYGFLPL